MIEQYLNTSIYTITILIILLIIFYAIGPRRSQIKVSLIQKQHTQNGSIILTFLLPKNIKKLELKIGQQIQIRTKNFMKQNNSEEKMNNKGLAIGKQFIPIQNNIGSFKILIPPTYPSIAPNPTSHHQQQQKLLQELKQLNKGQQVYITIVKNKFEYMGGRSIKIIDSSNHTSVKQYKNVYILAQGDKIPIAYQICKGICQYKSTLDIKQQKPNITILFVGTQITDFVLKNQFQNLEQTYNNIKYYYSIPVKGQRQPSIAGFGISSEKINQSFSFQSDDREGNGAQTFCILCAQQVQLCVVVQAVVRKRGVPVGQIYKY